MSAITSRPRVAELSPELVRTANLQARLGCDAVGAVVSSLIASANDALATTVERIARGSTNRVTVTSTAQLRAAFARIHGESLSVLDGSHTLSPGERCGIATAVALAGAGYILDDAVLLPALRAIRTAQTLVEARQSAVTLRKNAEAAHQNAVERALASACATASTAAGFASIETIRGLDGATRVIATDAFGRALVSEIRVQDDGPPSLITEVVGIADGNCQKILNEFDAALEALGVKADGPPKRSNTGGVPTLETARQTLRMLLARLPRKASSAETAPCLASEEELESQTVSDAVMVVGHTRG